MKGLPDRIAELRRRSFGPGDPRTPSIASRPGTPLSFENEASILEAQLRQLEHIQTESQRNLQEIKQYWSDPEHLKQKLDATIRAIAAHYRWDPREIAGIFAIEQETGSVVLYPAYQYVEVHLGSLPVYISEEAKLPAQRIPFLATVASLGITY